MGNENGTSNLVLQGLARVRLVGLTQENSFRVAKIEMLSRSLEISSKRTPQREGERVLYPHRKIGVPLPPNLMDHLRQIDSPEILSDVVAAAIRGRAIPAAELLEAYEVCERLRLLIQFLRSQVREN